LAVRDGGRKEAPLGAGMGTGTKGEGEKGKSNFRQKGMRESGPSRWPPEREGSFKGYHSNEDVPVTKHEDGTATAGKWRGGGGPKGRREKGKFYGQKPGRLVSNGSTQQDGAGGGGVSSGRIVRARLPEKKKKSLKGGAAQTLSKPKTAFPSKGGGE